MFVLYAVQSAQEINHVARMHPLPHTTRAPNLSSSALSPTSKYEDISPKTRMARSPGHRRRCI